MSAPRPASARRSAKEVINSFVEFTLSLFAVLRAVRSGRANGLRAGFRLEPLGIEEAGTPIGMAVTKWGSGNDWHHRNGAMEPRRDW